MTMGKTRRNKAVILTAESGANPKEDTGAGEEGLQR